MEVEINGQIEVIGPSGEDTEACRKAKLRYESSKGGLERGISLKYRLRLDKGELDNWDEDRRKC